ncbi:DUF2089 family protein [candidate division KSB1 bacterium]
MLPIFCPSCNERLHVKSMHCTNCQTNVEGSYELPVLLNLSAEEQIFIMNFVKASGSLKEMAKHLKLSYPTVRNRLDDLIKKIKTIENSK